MPQVKFGLTELWKKGWRKEKLSTGQWARRTRWVSEKKPCESWWSCQRIRVVLNHSAPDQHAFTTHVSRVLAGL